MDAARRIPTTIDSSECGREKASQFEDARPEVLLNQRMNADYEWLLFFVTIVVLSLVTFLWLVWR